MTGWYRRQFGISCPLEQSCPLFQDLAVCRMSFAQRLANKARATRNILRDEWIEETLEEFMEECQEAAEDGKYELRASACVFAFPDTSDMTMKTESNRSGITMSELHPKKKSVCQP